MERHRGRGRGKWRGGRGAGSRPQGGPKPRQYQSSAGPTGPRIMEEDCGLTCFLSTTPAISAIIKYRYSDFQVNEIDYKGSVVKLTDLTVPNSGKISSEGDKEVPIEQNVEVLPAEVWDKLRELSSSKDKSETPIEIDVTEKTKEERTKIHNVIYESFNSSITSTTKAVDSKKYIVCSKFDKKALTRQRWNWSGDYVHFVVYKEDCDTMRAAMLLKDGLKLNYLKNSFFGYAGTKDKRAKTSQWFSLKRVEPSKLVKAASKIRNIIIGNFRFENFPLKLGDLKGNRFRIALRDVNATKEHIEEAVSNLQNLGFINYYGLQRFGTRASVPTFQIGKNLIKGNYKQAIHLILEPYGPLFEMLKIYKETEDPRKALDSCHNKYYIDKNTIEITLLNALRSVGRANYVGALEKIPRNARLLYIHAYQSFIWNKCVSERIRLYGASCYEGDLVPINKDEKFEDNEIIPEDNDEDEDPPKEENDEGKNGDLLLEENDKSTEEKFKIITKEDIENKTYSIFDVVMPLPGYKVQYPPNMKDYYQSLLEADGLTLELKNRHKSYSLSGTYRHIVLKPNEFTWKLVNYSDPNCDLILSDIDEIRKKTLSINETEEKYKALILEINLPPSTYATMMLRELLKADTSAETQASKNNYHKEGTKCEDETDKRNIVEVTENVESPSKKVKV